MIKFLFGKKCELCRSGWSAKRWARYDGTGSWRMHERGSMTFDNFETHFCKRNGWFSRHRFVTLVMIIAIPTYSWMAWVIVAALFGGGK